MTDQKVLWEGMLLTNGRIGAEFRARVVEVEGAWLDKTYERGANLRLEREMRNDSGAYWTPISPYQVNSASLVIALAAGKQVRADE